MRLVPAISITTLVVSVAALVLVLLLFVTEPWEPEAEQPATKVHTQELDEGMVNLLIFYHVNELIESKGLSDEDYEGIEALPGYGCFWQEGSSASSFPDVKQPDGRTLTYNYVKGDDVWLITAIGWRCERDSGIDTATWAVDDNTGAITYGRPDVRDE